MIQSFTRHPWRYRIDLEPGALGALDSDRLSSPRGRPTLALAYDGLQAVGRRHRGEPPAAVARIELPELVATFSTSPSTVRVSVELTPAWSALLSHQDPTEVWRHLSRRLVVVDAGPAGGVHPTWRRLQDLDWTAAESQEVAA